jgi:hypothetical protein
MVLVNGKKSALLPDLTRTPSICLVVGTRAKTSLLLPSVSPSERRFPSRFLFSVLLPSASAG